MSTYVDVHTDVNMIKQLLTFLCFPISLQFRHFRVPPVIFWAFLSLFRLMKFARRIKGGGSILQSNEY